MELRTSEGKRTNDAHQVLLWAWIVVFDCQSEFREKVNDAIQCQFIFLDRVLTEICNTKLYKAKLHVFQFI